MRSLRSPLTLSLLFPLAFACSDDPDPTETATSAAEGTDGGTETGGGSTVVIDGQLTDFVSDANVAGVEVCVRDHPEIECAMSDAMGMYAIDYPISENATLLFTRDQYMDTLYPGVTEVPTTLSFQIATSDTMALLVSQAGETIDPTKGHMGVGGPEGSVVTLSPNSGTLVYFDENNLPDLTLTAMSARGLAGIANIDPGDLEVTVTHPTLTCMRGVGTWPGSSDEAAAVQIEANSLTAFNGFACL